METMGIVSFRGVWDTATGHFLKIIGKEVQGLYKVIVAICVSCVSSLKR